MSKYKEWSVTLLLELLLDWSYYCKIYFCVYLIHKNLLTWYDILILVNNKGSKYPMKQTSVPSWTWVFVPKAFPREETMVQTCHSVNSNPVTWAFLTKRMVGPSVNMDSWRNFWLFMVIISEMLLLIVIWEFEHRKWGGIRSQFFVFARSWSGRVLNNDGGVLGCLP